jgi:hypothetical protein
MTRKQRGIRIENRLAGCIGALILAFWLFCAIAGP